MLTNKVYENGFLEANLQVFRKFLTQRWLWFIRNSMEITAMQADSGAIDNNVYAWLWFDSHRFYP